MQNIKPDWVYLYTRKSTETDERQVLSIPAQLREMKEFALKNGIRIKETFQEARSASKVDNRPQYRKMIEAIQEDHKAGKRVGILVWHYNRLSRNWQETGQLLQLLNDKVISIIITPDKTIDGESSNDIVLGVEFGQNSQYSKELSKNVKRGYRQKINQGQFPSGAPVFYKNVGTEKQNKNIAPDPEIAHLFEPFVDWVIANNPSYTEAAKWLNKKGVLSKKGNPIKANRVRDILTNPIYCGILKFGNYPITKGTWEPLISEQKYRILQKTLEARSTKKLFKLTKDYKGLMRCAVCDCAVTSSHKIKKGKSYIYYHCSQRRGKHKHKYITEENLEEQLLEKFRSISMSEEAVDQVFNHLKEELPKESAAYKKVRDNVRIAVSEIDEQLDELLNLRLEKSITQEVFEYKKNQLEDRKRTVLEKRQDNEFNRDTYIESLAGFFGTLSQIEIMFELGEMDIKIRLIRLLCRDVRLDNGVVRLNFQKPWDTMLQEGFDRNHPVGSGLAIAVGNLLKNSRYAYLSDLLPLLPKKSHFLSLKQIQGIGV